MFIYANKKCLKCHTILWSSSKNFKITLRKIEINNFLILPVSLKKIKIGVDIFKKQLMRQTLVAIRLLMIKMLLIVHQWNSSNSWEEMNLGNPFSTKKCNHKITAKGKGNNIVSIHSIFFNSHHDHQQYLHKKQVPECDPSRVSSLLRHGIVLHFDSQMELLYHELLLQSLVAVAPLLYPCSAA